MHKHNPQQLEMELPVAKLCECGCGKPAPLAKRDNAKLGQVEGQPLRFISGHNSRLRGWRYEPDPTQEVALCACGCGRPAPIAMRNNAKLGHVRGQPIRFIAGHATRLRPTRSMEERFWEKVEKRGPDECWHWTAAHDQHGYGQLNLCDSKGRRMKAHRVAYELHYGPIPEGLEICHHCDNPSCVNPVHLFAGSHRDNMHDAMDKGRNSKPPRNGVRGERHGHATFTDQEVIDLRREFAALQEKQRVSIAAFAEWHDTPMVTMWRILRRKNYTHV